MSWTAFLFQTTTGQVGPQIHLEDQSWSIPLNETEEGSFTFRKSDLPAVNKDLWLAPWWAGVLLVWNNQPVFAGPIISRPSESFDYIKVECRGIRFLLSKRLVVQELSNKLLYATSSVGWSGFSLGTIAKKVVQQSMAKPGGYLPIEFPIADQAANHTRTYRGYNIGNINCDEVLTKLSNVSRGPDIMFKPRLVNDSKVVWDMWYGSEREPRIYQNNIPVWDTTAVQGDVTDMDVVVTGAHQTSRVYGSGAGKDRGTLIRVVEDERYLSKGFPMLETTMSDAGQTKAANLINIIQGNLELNLKPLVEIQLGVRGDGLNPIGSFWSGDDARIVVKDWVSIKDGTHKVRVLNVSGSNSSNVRVSVQTED